MINMISLQKRCIYYSATPLPLPLTPKPPLGFIKFCVPTVGHQVLKSLHSMVRSFHLISKLFHSFSKTLFEAYFFGFLA